MEEVEEKIQCPICESENVKSDGYSGDDPRMGGVDIGWHVCNDCGHQWE